MKSSTKEKFSGALYNLLGIGILIGLIVVGMWFQQRRDDAKPWRGTFYSGVGEGASVVGDDQFKTLEKCREWALKKAERESYQEGKWDYSCGNDCEFTGDEVVSGKRIQNYTCAEVTK